ncbi:MAG: hypothetical protein IAE90_07355 [Ignavibacteria bacterium]|nr:hypothetical protein [Ignavibacteria bacterium]
MEKLIKETKGTKTVEQALRGGKIDSKPESVTLDLVTELYTELGKLAFSLNNNKTAEKILKKKMFETPEGKQVKKVQEKSSSDKKRFQKVQDMLQSQLLSARRLKLEVPKEIAQSKLLSEGK